MSVQVREALHRHSYSLGYGLVLDRQGIVVLQWVMDDELFAIKLGNIIIGSRKIYSNIPRFQRSINEVVK